MAPPLDDRSVLASCHAKLSPSPSTPASTTIQFFMKRHEAFITKDWRTGGLSRAAIARIDDDGGITAGEFLIDSFCLGVKDAIFHDYLTKDEWKKIVEQGAPDDDLGMESVHPAWAKKFIEGAAAYASGIGFNPCRDFRKARRVLNGIDASACDETFVYGLNGRPHYVQGGMDNEDAARILAVLDSRLGPGAYSFALSPGNPSDADISDEALAKTRNELSTLLKHVYDESQTHMSYAAAGAVTAMLCQPDAYTPADLPKIFKADKPGTGTPLDKDMVSRLGDLFNTYWAQLDLLLDVEMHVSDPWPFDFHDDDFSDEFDHLWATIYWARGFMYVATTNEKDWSGALENPDLAPCWEAINYWANPATPGGLIDELKKNADAEETDNAQTNDAQADDARTDAGEDERTDDGKIPLRTAIITIYRTLHLEHGREEYAMLL